MTPDDKKRIDEIEARANATTEEPPWVCKACYGSGASCPSAIQDIRIGLYLCDNEVDVSRASAHFMVNSRADIPWLIAKIRELAESTKTPDAVLETPGGMLVDEFGICWTDELLRDAMFAPINVVWTPSSPPKDSPTHHLWGERAYVSRELMNDPPAFREFIQSLIPDGATFVKAELVEEGKIV